ncbi:Single-stranded DNA-binding protein SsbB [Planococcus massiliensis]|uniref:Single-stranded DNA-binding protein n=1 Tax=Planococcus massiliensis TaxID=1499687 RepID=A0A098EJG7_9BACL|nr:MULTISPECIES: single-stranded DNA-binding protein [Planococcus]MCJ1908203.1 single-stranded DNA-binding protein [Planococcus ruber]UJF26248.1 single-stranded DNA-binding protein [Planococcus sp. 107-1]CEG21955.1 Single-stranded DNA-binding protein SsbB [Planococcus massiliensis]
MNQVGIVGRLTKDPTMRVMSEGRVHTSFIVAVSRNYKNQRGEVETDFVLCSTWGKPAHNVSKYCTKGSLVAVTGRLQSRHYDKEDGSRVYVTEVLGDQIRFLDKKRPKEEAAPKPLEPGSEADFDFQPPGTATVIST